MTRARRALGISFYSSLNSAPNLDKMPDTNKRSGDESKTKIIADSHRQCFIPVALFKQNRGFQERFNGVSPKIEIGNRQKFEIRLQTLQYSVLDLAKPTLYQSICSHFWIENVIFFWELRLFPPVSRESQDIFRTGKVGRVGWLVCSFLWIARPSQCGALMM